MPIIHAPLNDDDFVDLSNMARRKGMTRSALASFILVAAIRKDEQKPEDEIKFNAQGLPLAAKLKLSEVPIIPQYERQ